MKPTGSTRTSSRARTDRPTRPTPETAPRRPVNAPPPTPTRPRNWTITTTNGYATTGPLPSWAKDDPSRTGIEPNRLHVELADVTHQAEVGGLILPVTHAMEPAADAGVLAVTIDCKPYPESQGQGPRVPVMNIQIVNDFWLKDLDPPEAAAIGQQLQALGELILTRGVPLLTAARAEWTSPTGPKHGTTRVRPRRLSQEPSAVTWAREKAGLTKRALAERIGISEQLMGEIESGWRSATPANLAKIATALNCPIVMLERKHPETSSVRSETPAISTQPGDSSTPSGSSHNHDPLP